MLALSRMVHERPPHRRAMEQVRTECWTHPMFFHVYCSIFSCESHSLHRSVVFFFYLLFLFREKANPSGPRRNPREESWQACSSPANLAWRATPRVCCQRSYQLVSRPWRSPRNSHLNCPNNCCRLATLRTMVHTGVFATKRT